MGTPYCRPAGGLNAYVTLIGSLNLCIRTLISYAALHQISFVKYCLDICKNHQYLAFRQSVNVTGLGI